jgi:protein-S-isoprenylcysteine O-methyltransferase Ste14
MPKPEHPGVLAPPPLLYVGALAVALALNWVWPVPIASHPALLWLGVAVVCAGLALNFWGAYSMIRAKTPINPYRPVVTVVDSGAFRVSRNPLYVGLHAIFLGMALILNTLWVLLAWLPLLAVIHYGVVLREERHLEAKFGEPYRRYSSKVRRYL